MTDLFQQNSYLQKRLVHVERCESINGGFRIELAETIFYPEGGGQPADHGWIGEAEVTDVQKVGDCIWHFVNQAVPKGEYLAQIDWSRRYDHMQQHTGQHLFTALALSEWGMPTVGFHLGAHSVGIELDVELLTFETAQAIAKCVNEEVLNAIPLASYELSRSDFTSNGVRSRATPDGVKGPFRIVEIPGLDKNTCGGTHVSNTQEIRGCIVLGVEKIRGRYRVNCLFGDRVLAAAKRWSEREKELNAVFCQGPTDHVAIARQWANSIQEYKRRHKKLLSELMASLGKSLAESDEKIVLHYRQGADLKSLSMLAASFCAVSPDKTLLLGGGQQGDGVFLIIAPQADLSVMKIEILSALNGNGGGKGTRMQGKCTNVNNLSALLGFNFGH